jgi:hypothetical protein
VAGETLILELYLRSTVVGRCLDPHVLLGDDRQDFERGVCGRRYLNLSGQADALGKGELWLKGRHCRLPVSGTLYSMHNPDYAERRIMLLAPHADDAELAAFGLYSRARGRGHRHPDAGRNRGRGLPAPRPERCTGSASERAFAQLGQPGRAALGWRVTEPMRAAWLLLPATHGDAR